MPRLIWSPPALLDVQRLHRFLLVKNADAAGRAVRAIREGVRCINSTSKSIEEIATTILRELRIPRHVY